MSRSFVLGCVWLSAVLIASAATNSRVPPPGIAIAPKDHAELTAGADELAREIKGARLALTQRPVLLRLLPDAEIFHKAVDWPLRYDEFYRSNEVAIARGLLKQGLERARSLRAGNAPWLTSTGLVVRGYLSRIDGSVQPYGLIVPASYANQRERARRLDVWLHGRDNHLTELKFISGRQRSYGEFAPADAFVLHPYGRYCNAFKFAGEADVFEAMEHVKQSYAIDAERVALRGFSMGGAGVWHLAAHHSHVWAVAAPGAGFAETAEYTGALSKQTKPPAWERKLWQLYDAPDYAANFYNLPVVAYNGTEDKQRQAADVMERAMKREGLTLPRVWGTNVGHKYTAEAKREINRFVDELMARGKDPLPSRVRMVTRTLRYGEAPGVLVTGLKKHWERAEIEVDRNTGIIRATNITAFALDTSKHPRREAWNLNRQTVEVTNEGIILFREDLQGRWRSERITARSPSIKRNGLQGPIDDAFMDTFLFVRPTGMPQNQDAARWIDERLGRAINDWRAQFRGDVRIKDDVNVTEEDIRQHHLVLWGDPQSNRLLARIADKLPIHWRATEVRVGTRKFTAKNHVPAFIFPNPLTPGHSPRYVVVNSGFTFAAAGHQSNALQTPKLPDYAVWNTSDDSVVLADFFDEHWQLQ